MVKLSTPTDENEAATNVVALRKIEQFFAD
jgi:hypothetical protein